jgi:hypothetical protein
MRKHLKFSGAALAAALAIAVTLGACNSDDPAAPAPMPNDPPPSILYLAQLSSANEVPAVAVPATGTATFVLTGKTLRYTVMVNGLSGNAAASHIHVGAAGTNGGIVYPFTASPVQIGQVAAGTIDLTQPVSNGTTSISGDALITLLNSGTLYTNVHTAANAGGEIRGQIIRQ